VLSQLPPLRAPGVLAVNWTPEAEALERPENTIFADKTGQNRRPPPRRPRKPPSAGGGRQRALRTPGRAPPNPRPPGADPCGSPWDQLGPGGAARRRPGRPVHAPSAASAPLHRGQSARCARPRGSASPAQFAGRERPQGPPSREGRPGRLGLGVDPWRQRAGGRPLEAERWKQKPATQAYIHPRGRKRSW
jgi:hypothetical protein